MALKVLHKKVWINMAILWVVMFFFCLESYANSSICNEESAYSSLKNICPFTVDLGPGITVCEGDDVTLIANNTAPNPDTYLWSTGQTTQSITLLNISSSNTFEVTVTDVSGCTARDEIYITVIPKPIGTAYTYQQCESSIPGFAEFDLNAIVNSHFGSANVSFYEDINLTIQIPLNQLYSSPTAIIFAVITQNGCDSDPIPITLDVILTDPLLYNFVVIDGGNCCDTLIVTVPYPGSYWGDFEIICDEGNHAFTILTVHTHLDENDGAYDDNDNTEVFTLCNNCTYIVYNLRSYVTECVETFDPPYVFTAIVPEDPDFNIIPGLICLGENIDLTTLLTIPPGFTVTFHYDNPTTNLNELSSTVVGPTENTSYYVRIEGNGCVYSQLVNVIITVEFTFYQELDVCENTVPFDLSSYINPFGIDGVWSGTGVTGNSFDPSGLSGQIILTFDPTSTCYANGTIVIEVMPDAPFQLPGTQICQSADVINLNTFVTDLGISGIWTGPGVFGNLFSPSGLYEDVELVFTPNDQCITPATFTISVFDDPIFQVTNSIQVCYGDTINLKDYVLSSIDDEVQFYKNSPDIPTNELPNSKVTLLSDTSFYIKVTTSDGCFMNSQIDINVMSGGKPKLGADTLCLNATPLDLTTLNDPNVMEGIWSGVGVTNNTFDPTGLLGDYIMTFTPTDDCYVTDSTYVRIANSPIVSGLTAICDEVTKTYIVSFDISQGDISSYKVNGLPSTSHFVSDTFPSNSLYTFTITDANRCEAVILQGSKNCACANSAGTMDFTGAPLTVCVSENVTASYNSDGILADNDRLVFVLHDHAGTVLGNILASSSQPVFSFPSNGVLGITYYISAVSADTTLQGTIDFTDVCFAVSAGVPVVFYEPKIKINPVNDVCVSSCADVGFTLSGQGPYQVVTSILSNNTVINMDTFNTINNNYLMTFCPTDYNDLTGVVTIKIEQFTDQHCIGKDIDSTISFSVFPERISTINSQLCQGESIVINGNTYNEINPTGTEIVVSQVSGQCDSIINIDLNFLPEVTSTLTQALCHTQSLLVNGTTYDVNNPTGTEIIIGGSEAGCDSTVVVNLTFTDEILENLNPTLCDGEFIMVNGTRYDVNHPTGTENIPSSDGITCDSVINIQLNFEGPKNNNINQTLCAGESININGIDYDATNPTDQLTLANQASNGCDSIININLSFLPPSSLTLEDTLCVEQNFVFDGVVYDVNNPSASYIVQNSNGCDSIVNIHFYFFPAEVDTVEVSLKMGESITYNGVVFDGNKMEGITTNPSTSANGCTRYTYVRLRFEEAFITATYVVVPESCPGENDGKILINDVQGCSNYVVTLEDSIINNPVFPIVIEGLAPGTYNLDIKGDVACVFTQNITINGSLSQGFVIDETIFDVVEGTTTFLNLGLSPEPASILWTPSTYLSCDDCVTPVLVDTAQSILYDIQLTDDVGCLFTSRVEVRVNKVIKDIVFPNIFSPNGDGQNDRWDIIVTNQIVVQVSVYDRWGNQVFNIEPNINQNLISWDGKKDGQHVLPGVYIYLIQYVDAAGKAVVSSGDVTVVK
jgi:gliding motility-associated-like protein